MAKKKISDYLNAFTTAKNNAIQKVKKTASNVVSNTGSSIKSGLTNAKDKVSNINLNLSLGFNALLPFKSTMLRALKRKGVAGLKDTDSIKKIALMFFNVIVSGKSSLDYAFFEQFNHAEEDGNYTDTGSELITEAGESIPYLAIITSIMNYIKNIFQKKDNGSTLNPDEAAIAEDAASDIDDVELDENGQPMQPMTEKTWFKALVAVLVLVVIVFIIKKFAK